MLRTRDKSLHYTAIGVIFCVSVCWWNLGGGQNVFGGNGIIIFTYISHDHVKIITFPEKYLIKKGKINSKLWYNYWLLKKKM